MYSKSGRSVRLNATREVQVVCHVLRASIRERLLHGVAYGCRAPEQSVWLGADPSQFTVEVRRFDDEGVALTVPPSVTTKLGETGLRASVQWDNQSLVMRARS